jgi:hypothetical protein
MTPNDAEIGATGESQWTSGTETTSRWNYTLNLSRMLPGAKDK